MQLEISLIYPFWSQKKSKRRRLKIAWCIKFWCLAWIHRVGLGGHFWLYYLKFLQVWILLMTQVFYTKRDRWEWIVRQNESIPNFIKVKAKWEQIRSVWGVGGGGLAIGEKFSQDIKLNWFQLFNRLYLFKFTKIRMNMVTETYMWKLTIKWFLWW